MDGEIAQRSGDEADKEMTRLWRTWRTVYEMLSDRVSFYSQRPLKHEWAANTALEQRLISYATRQQGYEVSDDELQLSLIDFKHKYADPMGYPEYAIPQVLTSIQFRHEILDRGVESSLTNAHILNQPHQDENPSPPH